MGKSEYTRAMFIIKEITKNVDDQARADDFACGAKDQGLKSKRIVCSLKNAEPPLAPCPRTRKPES
jgi:hypothetical protein